MSISHKLTITLQAHSPSGDAPALGGRGFLYEVAGLPGNEQVQIVSSAGGKKSSWQIHYVATRQKTGDYKTKEEALSALAATSQPKTLEEIKKSGPGARVYKNSVRNRDLPGGVLEVLDRLLVTCQRRMYGTAHYVLEGDKANRHKVRVHKTLGRSRPPIPSSSMDFRSHSTRLKLPSY